MYPIPERFKEEIRNYVKQWCKTYWSCYNKLWKIW
jgi:hypothetical protein